MLCRSCHIHVRRDFPYCLRCGTLRKGASVAEFEAPSVVFRLVSNGMREQRVQLDGASTTLGRTDDNDVTLDDTSVSRRHATISRTDAGYVVVDHGSFNGTTVTTLDGTETEVGAEPVPLTDHATIHVGDVDVLFDQPRSAAVGNRTQVKDIAGTVLGHTADGAEEPPPATEPLDTTPRRRSGWALKETSPGNWVLRNTRTNAYLQLDERDVFLWNRLDGRNSLRDLLFAYLEEYGELALPRIEATVRSLHQAGLVRGLPGDVEEVTFWGRVRRVVVKNLIRVELSVKGLDPLAEKLYHGFAWRFFSAPAVVLLWALTLGGLAAFVLASSEKQLFDFGGAGIVGVIATAAFYVVATTLHEMAHALAVKSYGRRVNRGGFLLMMGMPFAFVDTSDMWFGTSWSRIVVAVSGPLTTLGLAGGASIAALTVPSPVAAGICFTLAAGLYLNTMFNLIPLMPLDGYQALADALRTPRLKEEAKAYFGGGFLADLRAGRRPGPKQLGLLVFGVLSAVCLWGMLSLSVLTWNSRIGGLARDHVSQPWLTVLVVVVLALLLFPVWYGKVRAISARLRARRQRSAAVDTSPAAASSAPVEDAPAEDAPAEDTPVDDAPGVAVDPAPAARAGSGLPAGPLEAVRAVEILAGVAEIVAVAHEAGRAHGGVRWAAVGLTPDGGVELAEPPATTGAAADADLDYAAPEVFDGDAGPAADVYALGALLHQLLTGRRPFPVTGGPALMRAHLATPPPTPGRTPGVAPEFDGIVATAMAKEPGERYATVLDLVDAAVGALDQAAAAPAPDAPAPDVPAPAPASPATPASAATPASPATPATTAATHVPRRARASADVTRVPDPERRREPTPTTAATHIPTRTRSAGTRATDSTYIPGR